MEAEGRIVVRTVLANPVSHVMALEVVELHGVSHEQGTGDIDGTAPPTDSMRADAAEDRHVRLASPGFKL